jgi:photosystem II stability/assembly factor-like uncharacterized protein
MFGTQKTPSLPDTEPRSNRPRRGGCESNFPADPAGGEVRVAQRFELTRCFRGGLMINRWTGMLVLMAGLAGATARGQDATGGWKAVNGTWDGGSSAAIWKMAAWPGKDEVIISTRANGLWSTKDGGKTWQRMGAPEKTPPNHGQAVQFVFDPADAKTFWTSGMYQYGVWKTADGGQTFSHISQNNHVDGFAVDLTDPQRRVQLMGLHEQEHSLHKSTDGGATWVKIGDNVPQGSEFTADPIILDAKTYIVDSSGWSKPGEHWGIYRSEDGGDTWTQVSAEGASGNATVTSTGDIFWSCLYDRHIIRSKDHGKTWEKIKGPARDIVLEVAPHRLVALGGNHLGQLYVSKDEGDTWTPFGDPLPFKARGFAYDSVRKSFFAATDHGDKNERLDGDVVRWDLPGDLEMAFAPKSADLTVWDGEGFADGHGWIAPAGKGTLGVSTAEHYNGQHSLEFHVKGVATSSGGWNWADWQMPAASDVSGFESLSFYAKVTGQKPAEVQVSLVSGPDKVASETVGMAKYAPDFMDGQWHRITVPLKDLHNGKFNPKTAYELRLLTNEAPESDFNIYLDVVQFLRAPAK